MVPTDLLRTSDKKLLSMVLIQNVGASFKFEPLLS
jgi:hypothetical protein